ncbi:MAG: hypothetical protein ABI830_10620 [Pseudolabrys sp.]
MLRSLGYGFALALAATAILLPQHSRASDRTLPMRFDLRLQGPAEACGANCLPLISASGAITADTPRDFKLFAQGRDLFNTTLVLDSDGGSVLGAIALGRELRRLAIATTVGRVTDIQSRNQSLNQSLPRAQLSPRADCESMCAFVLLGGVHRSVPAEARVMVHQIWLGDRREDPTAANYSAEDLVLVQRDIGRLAQYTADMGGGIDLLDLALRIPPWEPMHAMTRDELRRTKLANADATPRAPETAAASPTRPAASQPSPRVTNGLHASPISEMRWAMVERAGIASLARRHPLTVEGEDLGNFDLVVTCGAGHESYDVSYVERRRRGEVTPLPDRLGAVVMRVGSKSARLKVVTSEPRGDQNELATFAAGPVPAAMIGAFAAAGNHSVVIETETDGMVTVIRLGNTGARQGLSQLGASCAKGAVRAELPLKKTGGLAAAQ